MKKVIALFIMTFALAVGVSAQQTQNEGYIGYTFTRQNVELNSNAFSVRNDDMHGVTVGYSRFAKGEAGKAGVLGLTGEVSAVFGNNDSNLVTVMAGGIAKARNSSYVQPFVRVMGGVGRQNVSTSNFRELSDTSFVFDAGTGLDFNLGQNSRYKVRVSADYLNNGFRNEREHGFKSGVGIVF